MTPPLAAPSAPLSPSSGSPARKKQESTSRSGIITSQNGERHIPSSTRADGSVRKEIKVRPGYRPPEDIEVYKNRTAEAWKTRGSGGVPGAQFVELSTSKKKAKPEKTTPKAAAGSKSATVGELEKRSTVTASKDQVEVQKETDGVKESEQGKEADAEEEDPETVNEREARKLSKKLRQARDLEKKKENGDSLLPEQFEKIIRINELVRQLGNLGFDAEGQRKT